VADTSDYLACDFIEKSQRNCSNISGALELQTPLLTIEPTANVLWLTMGSKEEFMCYESPSTSSFGIEYLLLHGADMN
jgi:hypothetical protein